MEFYCTLSSEEREDLHRVLLSMERRFGTMVNVEAVRSKLEAMRQKPGQSIQDLAQHTRALAFKVYANDTIQRREQEAIRCFMRALSSGGVRQALITAHPIATFSNAIDLATQASELLQAYSAKPVSVRQVQDCTLEESEEPGEDTRPGWRTRFR